MVGYRCCRMAVCRYFQASFKKTHEILHLKMILSNVQTDITTVYLSLTLLLSLSLGVGIQDWVRAGAKFHFCYSCY